MRRSRKSGANVAIGEHHEGHFGIYMAHKQAKQKEQFAEQQKLQGTAGIFQNVRIYVTGRTQPTWSELRDIVGSRGGYVDNYLSHGQVTHIIAANLPQSKVKEFLKWKSRPPIVSPAWITESVKQNKKLSITEFLLPQFRERSTTLPFSTASGGGEGEGGGEEEGEEEGEGEDPMAQGPSIAPATAVVQPPPSRDIAAGAAPGTSTSSAVAPTRSKKGIQTTGTDPNFMSKYWKSSRLHFLGAWKAHVQQIVDVTRGSGPGMTREASVAPPSKRQRIEPKASSSAGGLPPMGGAPTEAYEMEEEAEAADAEAILSTKQKRAQPDAAALAGHRSIVHLDLDCFFASVGMLGRPELHGKPVVVSHSGVTSAGGRVYSRGEISSANYEARKFGIRAGMFLGEARQLCPHLQVVPYRFDLIQRISEEVFRIMLEVTPKVQPLSVDEAYLDIIGCGDPETVVANLRRSIYEQTGVTASAGIARNVLVARVATGKAKPNGQLLVNDYEVDALLNPLPVGKLPGVGWKTNKKLKGKGIHTVEDLRKVPLPTLTSMFGQKTGESLYRAARGVDHRKVTLHAVRKSIGAEVNWGVRFATSQQVLRFLRDLSFEVAQRLARGSSHDSAQYTPAEPPKAISPNPTAAAAHKEQQPAAPGPKLSFPTVEAVEEVEGSQLSPDPVEEGGVDEGEEEAAVPGAASTANEIYRDSIDEATEALPSANNVASVAGSSTRLSSMPPATPLSVRGRTITLKAMQRHPEAPLAWKSMGHGMCTNMSRSVTLAVPTRDALAIYREVKQLWSALGIPPMELRGVGIQLSKLVSEDGRPLPGDSDDEEPDKGALHRYFSKGTGSAAAGTKASRQVDAFEHDFEADAAAVRRMMEEELRAYSDPPGAIGKATKDTRTASAVAAPLGTPQLPAMEGTAPPPPLPNDEGEGSQTPMELPSGHKAIGKEEKVAEAAGMVQQEGRTGTVDSIASGKAFLAALNASSEPSSGPWDSLGDSLEESNETSLNPELLAGLPADVIALLSQVSAEDSATQGEGPSSAPSQAGAAAEAQRIDATTPAAAAASAALKAPPPSAATSSAIDLEVFAQLPPELQAELQPVPGKGLTAPAPPAAAKGHQGGSGGEKGQERPAASAAVLMAGKKGIKKALPPEAPLRAGTGLRQTTMGQWQDLWAVSEKSWSFAVEKRLQRLGVAGQDSKEGGENAAAAGAAVEAGSGAAASIVDLTSSQTPRKPSPAAASGAAFMGSPLSQEDAGVIDERLRGIDLSVWLSLPSKLQLEILHDPHLRAQLVKGPSRFITAPAAAPAATHSAATHSTTKPALAGNAAQSKPWPPSKPAAAAADSGGDVASLMSAHSAGGQEEGMQEVQGQWLQRLCEVPLSRWAQHVLTNPSKFPVIAWSNGENVSLSVPQWCDAVLQTRDLTLLEVKAVLDLLTSLLLSNDECTAQELLQKLRRCIGKTLMVVDGLVAYPHTVTLWSQCEAQFAMLQWRIKHM